MVGALIARPVLVAGKRAVPKSRLRLWLAQKTKGHPMSFDPSNYIKKGQMVATRGIAQEAVVRDYETPCQGCENATRCSTEGLACMAYHTYANHKKAICLPSDWEGQPKEPNKQIFDHVWSATSGRISKPNSRSQRRKQRENKN